MTRVLIATLLAVLTASQLVSAAPPTPAPSRSTPSRPTAPTQAPPRQAPPIAAPPSTPAHPAPAHPRLTYATIGGKPLTLDLYLPQGAPGPYPLVIYIHGGGWSGGASFPVEFAPDLLARGYAVASVNYRLTSEGGAWGGEPVVFPAQIHDVKGAVRWLRANARNYNLDPKRFAAMGTSAGGHLAALLGASGGVESLEGTVGGNKEVSSAVQAVVDFYGPTDILNMSPDVTNPPGAAMDHDLPTSPGSRLIGFDKPGQGLGVLRADLAKSSPQFARFAALARDANPITWVDAKDPPFFVAHGTNDSTVALGQSQRLADALAGAGVAHTFSKVPGVGHGGLGARPFHEALDFLDQRLKARVSLNADPASDRLATLADLNLLFAGLGACCSGAPGVLAPGDLNGDGAVDFFDLCLLLGDDGRAC